MLQGLLRRSQLFTTSPSATSTQAYSARVTLATEPVFSESGPSSTTICWAATKSLALVFWCHVGYESWTACENPQESHLLIVTAETRPLSRRPQEI